ncbi:MAG: hypothetical protein K6D37_09840 [Prevotella sp.]|nr:hypothetical protein [Prevotella sp.]
MEKYERRLEKYERRFFVPSLGTFLQIGFGKECMLCRVRCRVICKVYYQKHLEKQSLIRKNAGLQGFVDHAMLLRIKHRTKKKTIPGKYSVEMAFSAQNIYFCASFLRFYGIYH